MSLNTSMFSGALARGLALSGVVAVVGLCAAGPALASTTYELSPFAGNGGYGLPTPGAATSSTLYYPDDVAVDASGDVYIADSLNNEVEKVTPSGQLSVIAGTGSAGTPTAGPATSSRLDDPTGVAVDAAGDVYIADNDNAVVEKVTPSGQLSLFAGEVGNSNGTPTQGSRPQRRSASRGGLLLTAPGTFISRRRCHMGGCTR